MLGQSRKMERTVEGGAVIGVEAETMVILVVRPEGVETEKVDTVRSEREKLLKGDGAAVVVTEQD